MILVTPAKSLRTDSAMSTTHIHRNVVDREQQERNCQTVANH
jgi:hypothetical protein